ncbi:hypothetical protein GY45DRAFT_966842 [Cubamyces sp. BRFM 1775]|nr:hypothetical protein GY45DRAFT_966842 [Cubamyces sp. BRFM 1775]
MSAVKKCVVVWKAEPTLPLALTLGCRAAEHLEHLLLFWPCDPIRTMWQAIREELVKYCIEAGMPLPSAALPRPLPRKTEPSPPTVMLD